MTTAIIVAAGRGQRMGAKLDKAFLSLGSRPVVAYSLMAFEQCVDIQEIVLVVRREQVAAAKGMTRMFGISKMRQIVAGGQRRQDSVNNGLAVLAPETRIVAIHDAARPLVTPDLISETIRSARKNGSGVAAARLVDTIKYVERGLTVQHTVDRSKLWAVQTPQTFKIDLLRRAYEGLVESNETVTDDAAAVERLGEPVRLVENEKPNLKITIAEDLRVAAAILRI